jgi:L-malate glycosyltransferase
MAKTVRILFEIHPHTLGGTERFLARLLPRLDRRLYEPVVISQKRGAPLQLLQSLGFQTKAMGDYFKASGLAPLADFIRGSHIGLVQSNYYSSNLAMAANLAGVPHIWRLGGHVDVGSGVRTARQSQWALDVIRMLSSSIICNSKYVRSQFLGRSRSPRIEVIPNGISIPPRLSPKKNTGVFSVGMIAHFTPQKRHIDFIRAAKLVAQSRQDVTFTILGQSYAHSESRVYADKVQRWSRTLERQGKLNISDFKGSEDGALRRFDCVVLPSLRESFSNAILESMAAGVPVIAARSGGHPELVEHRRTGFLVPPTEPEAIAKAIQFLLNKPELLDQMGQAAARRAQNCFSMDECVRRYEAVYEKVSSDSD